MFFKRKKKQEGRAGEPDGETDASAKRRHYRRSPSRKHALGVKVSRKGATIASAEVGDLAIGGVRLIFPKGAVPDLTEGEVVELNFSSLMHPGSVHGNARFLRALRQPDGSLQHVLEFTDLDALYPQLDPFFWNFFNRRRFVRIRPALDRRLPLSLQAGAAAFEVSVNDVSTHGVGFVLEASRAEGLLAAANYEISFPIPGSEERFASRAERRHATPHGKNVLFGLEFVGRETSEESILLQRYLAGRESEQARWE